MSSIQKFYEKMAIALTAVTLFYMVASEYVFTPQVAILGEISKALG